MIRTFLPVFLFFEDGNFCKFVWTFTLVLYNESRCFFVKYLKKYKVCWTFCTRNKWTWVLAFLFHVLQSIIFVLSWVRKIMQSVCLSWQFRQKFSMKVSWNQRHNYQTKESIFEKVFRSMCIILEVDQQSMLHGGVFRVFFLCSRDCFRANIQKLFWCGTSNAICFCEIKCQS